MGPFLEGLDLDYEMRSLDKLVWKVKKKITITDLCDGFSVKESGDTPRSPPGHKI